MGGAPEWGEAAASECIFLHTGSMLVSPSAKRFLWLSQWLLVLAWLSLWLLALASAFGMLALRPGPTIAQYLC